MKARIICDYFLISLFFSLSYIQAKTVTAEVSCGELIDKITILMIKSQRIANQEKLKNIIKELTSLQKTRDSEIGFRQDVAELQALLQKINEKLWDIEDTIRLKERKQEFDHEFITIARNVYITNDQRCAIKKQIDILLGSDITEEKSYEPYLN